MSLQKWALPELRKLLPLEDSQLEQILSYSNGLSDEDATKHLKDLLGESPDADSFISSYLSFRSGLNDGVPADKLNKSDGAASNIPPPLFNPSDDPVHMEPPPDYPAPRSTRQHMNDVIRAGMVRAKDEQDMQQHLQNLRYQYGIWNDDVEPEHDTEYWCNCPIHQYQWRKYRRYGVQDMWARAVMYPGEKAYNDNVLGRQIISNNPYKWRTFSPYGWYGATGWTPSKPVPSAHAQYIHQVISLNNSLNQQAQAAVNAMEPRHSIWEMESLEDAVSKLVVSEKKDTGKKSSDKMISDKKGSDKKEPNQDVEVEAASSAAAAPEKKSKLTSFRKAMGIKNSEERAIGKAEKSYNQGNQLRLAIEAEERGRWPDSEARNIVAQYQEKTGMAGKIAHLRAKQPLQYYHLLKAGYFEPIPVAWAYQNSNPLKFSVESVVGWRGITPAWRGYEDLAEERLYWVLNHRDGPGNNRLKPDFISALNMARARMATAVEPPPLYFAADDTCNIQHTGNGYSKQVMPPPFQPHDRPEVATDDTMVLLDVSGSMDFDPLRPVYDKYLVTGFTKSTQPKNKDVAKAVIRRFTDAMANHDHLSEGYDLVTFSDRSQHLGKIKHTNLDSKWHNVRFGGGTRVMTGWQKVKELHFQKHSESAIHDPVWGWQAGPQTPMLRLLLLLDGEATDMDEFELDLLGLSWAHVTIFLIGVDGCPHHHRHANELQRISDVNQHVSFVDAQGNCPERYVTHELLKRHLGYDVSMQEFTEMEQPPPYSES